MPEATPILKLDTPHFTVILDDNLLRIDLKGSLRNEIEEALENKPILKKTFGVILSIFVPLHIRLVDIVSVGVDKEGNLKIDLPHHRDLLVPLERKDSERLAAELNELIPREKKKEWEDKLKKRRLMLQDRARKHAHGRHVPTSSYETSPWYFPTEQVDNVPMLRPRRKRKRLSRRI